MIKVTLEENGDLETFSDSSVDDTVSKTENVNAGTEVVKVETIEEQNEESKPVSVDKDDSVSVKDDVATINDTNENIETDIVDTAQDNLEIMRKRMILMKMKKKIQKV